MTHEQFVSVVVDPNDDFQAFLSEVGGSHSDHLVSWTEFFSVLKLLWDIFNALQRLGWFSRWTLKRQVSSVLRKPSTPVTQERALIAILSHYQ